MEEREGRGISAGVGGGMLYMLDRRLRLDENDWLGWAVERGAEPLLFKEDREEGGG